MGKSYSQLTLRSREKIYELKGKGFSKDSIAETLGCHRSTIYRELRRNKSRLGYLPDKAHKMALDRCINSLKIERNSELKADIIDKLQRGWSPEIISGYLKKEKGISVISHETIYAYIYSKNGCERGIYLTLQKRRKKRKARSIGKIKKSICIPNRVSIHNRPPEINERISYGHWEGDLMLFSNQSANLITLRERKSRFLIAIKNPSKHSEITAKNIKSRFKGRKKILIETLTLDNGGEFAKHENIAKCLKSNTFFCDPYSSYQKGCVENGNGVLRYDLPRSTEINSLTQRRIDKIVNKINNRPMKCLGFYTPAEVFRQNYGLIVSKP
jgi:IS30 family transposase